MTSQVVTIETVGEHIALLRMQDKENRNTFSDRLTEGLMDAFARVSAEERYKVVVLTGYDSYFCSGGSKDALISLYQGEAKFNDRDLYSLALNCPIPVISAMQGHGIGGGFVMGLFADIIILSRESIYTANFMKYGFTPGMGATCIMPKKLGIVLAEEMMFTAETFRGEELARRGVPFAVLPRNEVLDHALEVARSVADKPRRSLTVLKDRLVQDLRSALPAAIEHEVEMHDKTFHHPEVRERIELLFGK